MPRPGPHDRGEAMAYVGGDGRLTVTSAEDRGEAGVGHDRCPCLTPIMGCVGGRRRGSAGS